MGERVEGGIGSGRRRSRHMPHIPPMPHMRVELYTPLALPGEPYTPLPPGCTLFPDVMSRVVWSLYLTALALLPWSWFPPFPWLHERAQWSDVVFAAASLASSGLSGQPAPDFALKSSSGENLRLSEYRGDVVMVNFWATWCGPCRGEMPYLEAIYKEWAGKGLVFYAINSGETTLDARKFMEANNLTMPVLLDPNQEVSRKYGIMGIPTTYFIDRNGIIQGKVVGLIRETFN